MKSVKQNTKNIDTNFNYHVIVTCTYAKDVRSYTFYAKDYDGALKLFKDQVADHCEAIQLLSNCKYVVGIYRTMHGQIEIVRQVQMQGTYQR